MSLFTKILIGAIALLHVYFLWLEMFGWTSRGPKVFKNVPVATFKPSKVLAANQGLYNGFLAAGLVWALLISSPEWSKNTAIFFLACITIAGLYGAVTVDRKIAVVQAAPAIFTLLAITL